MATPNAGDIAASSAHFIHQLVAAQATVRPDAPAVTTSSTQLAYSELERRASAFSQVLRPLGVGHGDIVALSLSRSPDLIVTALATMNAGAAYLPTDPETPPERLLFILRDSKAKVLVTESAVAQRIGTSPCAVLTREQLSKAAGDIRADPPQVPLQPEDLAYVIYTSGSTGVPKGVEITHANLANLIAWHNRAFQVGSDDRASQLAGLGFDASVWETWPYLATGANLRLAEPDTLISPEHLRDWLLVSGITVSFVPTPMAERLLSLEWPVESSLRILLTGGDTLHVRPPADLHFQVVNNYGPTECTVVATSGEVSPAGCASLPSIGRAIDNTQVYILDEQMQPVPPGSAGEVYVGGANVGRGYCNRPDLTAERFVPNPFAPATRLYRTGDCAQLMPDGEIAFLGRVDHQIKIRGYRIEPDEIVAVLNTHPSVIASAVTTRGEGDGKHLVAYVIAPTAPTRCELQGYLLKSLPEYMVPATFVRVDDLPLTPNGKLDCGALPEPSPHNTLVDNISAPASETEAALARILSSLLAVPEVGPEDDFFLLGGHSLLGTQLIARIRDGFGIEVPLLTLFERPTVRGLSAEIEQLLVAKTERRGKEDDCSSCIPRGNPIAPAA